ncbi:MAG: hypothetical protein ACJ8J0_00465 [Longimicrobiaceae bacterium]
MSIHTNVRAGAGQDRRQRLTREEEMGTTTGLRAGIGCGIDPNGGG